MSGSAGTLHSDADTIVRAKTPVARIAATLKKKSDIINAIAATEATTIRKPSVAAIALSLALTSLIDSVIVLLMLVEVNVVWVFISMLYFDFYSKINPPRCLHLAVKT